MTKTYTIHGIVEEFNRLAATQIKLLNLFGIHTTHIGDTEGDTSTIYLSQSQGKNDYFIPTLSISNQDIQQTGETLTKMKQAKSLQSIQHALTKVGIHSETFSI